MAIAIAITVMHPRQERCAQERGFESVDLVDMGSPPQLSATARSCGRLLLGRHRYRRIEGKLLIQEYRVSNSLK